MSFLKRLKHTLYDYRRGTPVGKILVCEKDLQELIHHFEFLDNKLRIDDILETKREHYRLLDLAVKQLWLTNNMGSEEILLQFSETMQELITEKKKQNQYKQGVKYERKTDGLHLR